MVSGNCHESHRIHGEWRLDDRLRIPGQRNEVAALGLDRLVRGAADWNVDQWNRRTRRRRHRLFVIAHAHLKREVSGAAWARSRGRDWIAADMQCDNSDRDGAHYL